MLFDSAMLTRICADLQEVLRGCRVRRVVATGKLEVAMETSAQGGAPWLVVCGDSEFGRIHLAQEAEPRPDIHSPLADVMRRYLQGAIVQRIEQIDFDRLLHIEFVNAQRLGAEVNRYRQSLPGLKYLPPPDFGKWAPFAVKAAELSRIAGQADPDLDFAGQSRLPNSAELPGKLIRIWILRDGSAIISTGAAIFSLPK